MMEVPTISIVIVNYNVKQLLLDCLTSVFQSSDPAFKLEVIVVDNHSEDGSVAAVKEKFPQVILIENKSNIGFPAANNQAFVKATGEFILMLNPDTEIKEQALLKLHKYFELHKDVSICGPKLLNPDGSLQYSAWRLPKIRYILAEMFYLNSWIGSKYYLEKDFNVAFEVESLSGAAIFFRREVLEKTKGLDEYLFWIEDIDFCFRANKVGFKVMYFPEAEVVHHIGQSAKKNYRVSISNQVFNKIKFYKVHYRPLETATVIFISFVDAVCRGFVFGILSPFSKVFFLKSRAYLYTAIRLFNPPAGM